MTAQQGPRSESEQPGQALLAMLPLAVLAVAVLIALGLISTTIGGAGMLVGTMNVTATIPSMCGCPATSADPPSWDNSGYRSRL